MRVSAWCRRKTIPPTFLSAKSASARLVVDEDDDDDERSYNFEMKITLGDATYHRSDIKQLDAYLKRKFDNERVRVVARVRKKDSAEVYVGEEYIGVLFFDEKDPRSSFFELPILALRSRRIKASVTAADPGRAPRA